MHQGYYVQCFERIYIYWRYQNSKVFGRWNFKSCGIVYTTSSTVWFLKHSKQMRLLHKVTFLRFKQCLQRALLYGIGQCPPSIHTELVDNFLAEKSLIKLLTNWKWKASWVLFLWFLDNFSKIKLSSHHLISVKLIIEVNTTHVRFVH